MKKKFYSFLVAAMLIAAQDMGYSFESNDSSKEYAVVEKI